MYWYCIDIWKPLNTYHFDRCFGDENIHEIIIKHELAIKSPWSDEKTSMFARSVCFSVKPRFFDAARMAINAIATRPPGRRPRARTVRWTSATSVAPAAWRHECRAVAAIKTPGGWWLVAVDCTALHILGVISWSSRGILIDHYPLYWGSIVPSGNR